MKPWIRKLFGKPYNSRDLDPRGEESCAAAPSVDRVAGRGTAQAEAQRLIESFSVMATAVATFDERGALLFANEAFAKLLDLKADELRPGREWRGLLPQLLHESESGEAVAGGVGVDRASEVDRRFWQCDAPVDFRTPGDRVVELRTRRSAKGDVVAVLDEVTLERRRQAALEDQALEVGRTEAQLREFARVVAHDVKAPVRQIKIQISWLQEALGSENYSGAALYCLLLGKSLESLRRMLFDLTRYYTEDEALAPLAEIDTGALVQTVLSQLDVGSRKVHVGTAMPVIRAERVPLEIVLRNLIWNAVRHHDRAAGEIWVSAVLRQQVVLFRVSDDGPGMPDEVLQRLRAPGSAMPQDASLRTGGMGLLLIRQIIESRGGRLEVDRRAEARGTTVSVSWSLPRSEENEAMPHESTEAATTPAGVLR